MRQTERFGCRRQRLPGWQVRGGIDYGPVAAGIVGKRRYTYDIWGDTVNSADRAQKCARPGKIALSHRAWVAVEEQVRGTWSGPHDANGKPRPLHLEESIACTDFERGPVQPVVARSLNEGDANIEELVRCPYFVIRRHMATTAVSLADRDEFRILLILSGNGSLETSSGVRNFEKGTTILIPACCKSLRVVPETSISFLEVFGPGHAN